MNPEDPDSSIYSTVPESLQHETMVEYDDQYI